MKKFIAAVIALCMALTVLPAVSLAADTVSIGTAEELMQYFEQLRGGVQNNAVLTADIDLSGYLSVDNPMQPIPVFEATFDGDLHSVKGLHIGSAESAALFVDLGGTVMNVSLEGTVAAGEAAGIAIGSRGTVSHVKTVMNVFGRTRAAGMALTNTGVITGSDSRGDVKITENNSLAAGIACVNSGIISGCANYSTVAGRTLDGGAKFAGGICAFSTGTVTGCANAGIISGGDMEDTGNETYTANISSATGVGGTGGIVGVAEGAGKIENSVNSGSVSGDGIINVGGIAGFSAQTVTDVTNYGEVAAYTHNDEAADKNEAASTGGIAGMARAAVENARNYGRIFGDTRTGGIVGTGSDTKNSVNYGRIEGTDTQGGIAGEVNGLAYGCTNYGEIHGSEDRTGGVAGKLSSGSIELCANMGVVSGAENRELTSNYTGGIVGRMDEGAAGLKNVYGTVEISAPYGSAGGAGCKLNTDLSGFIVNLGPHNIDGSQGNRHFDTANFYWRDNKWGEDKWPENIVDLLNAEGNVWVMGPDGYPVFAKDTLSDGAVHVRTAEELRNALANEAAMNVVVDGVVDVDGDVSVVGGKTLSGGQLRLNGGSLVMTAWGEFNLGNISIRTSGAPAVRVNGTFNVKGIVDTNASIVGETGVIYDVDGIILNGGENAARSDITISDSTGLYYVRPYRRDGMSFYNYVPEDAAVVTGIAALAADNPSLAFDVYAVVRGGAAQLFLPGTANLASVTFTGVNGDGLPVQDKKWTADLSGGKTYGPVRIGGFDYTVSALQSSLPALSFNIDESFGTIAAMNTSTDHSVKCYGSANIYVPEALKAQKGWTDISSLDYQDKDPDKSPGTMEIKGRGNSTWVADLTTKKPYQFKFEKKVDVLGMGESKTWVILKNDERYIINKLAFDLGLEMGLENSSHSEFVDVFMNGEYLGNYLLCEKVEVGKSRVNVSDLDDEYEANGNSVEGLDLTGGYLLEIDNWDGDAVQIQYDPDNDGVNDTVVSIKSPEDLAVTASADADNPYSYIYNYVTDFLDAVYGDGIMSDGRSYLDHIDKDSFVKYFLHQEFLRNKDCGIGSTYLYKDKDGIDPLLYAGPLWDNDRAISSWTYDEWTMRTVTRPPNGSVALYNQLSRRPDFAALVVDYYRNSDVRTVFANAYKHIEDYNAYAGSSFAMDALRWDITVNNEWMIDILKKRAEWLDANYQELLTLAQSE